MSGVFYITTVENDEIWFYDINGPIKLRISFAPKEQNKWKLLYLNLCLKT